MQDVLNDVISWQLQPLWWSNRYGIADSVGAGAGRNLFHYPLQNFTEFCLIFPVLRGSFVVNRFSRRRITTFYDISVDYVITITVTSWESSLHHSVPLRKCCLCRFLLRSLTSINVLDIYVVQEFNK